MENRSLHLLIIDDSPDDAELPVKVIREAGYRLTTQRVYNLAGMESALQKGGWDLVLSDFSLLQFSAQMALDMLKRKNIDIPLIILTRSISDSNLMAITAAGARDVVKKNDTACLVPTIRRELEVADMRRELISTRKIVGEMENKHSAMVSGTQEAICYCHEGMHIEANQAYISMFGYNNLSDLETIPILDLINKKDQKKFKDTLRKIAKGKTLDSSMPLEAIKLDGSPLHVEAAFATVKLKGEDCIQITLNDISSRRATEDRLKFLTQRDALTGLFNRHYFTKELGRVLNNARKTDQSGSLIYFDLYQLNEINDTFGYTFGDGILLKITKLFREELGENIILSRFGDQELMVLLENQDVTRTDEVAKKLKKLLSDARFSIGNKKHPCGCAVGISIIDKNLKNAHEAVTQAVIQSKGERPTQKAKTDVSAKAPADSSKVSDTHETGSKPSSKILSDPGEAIAKPADEAPADLPGIPIPSVTAPAKRKGPGDPVITQALEQNSFRLLYQPVVSMMGDADELYEVLLRMVDKDDQLIGPGKFIANAEKNGQIIDIDLWVIKRVMDSIAAMVEVGRRVTYFVNISPQTLADGGLISLIFEGIKQSQMDPEQLILELSHHSVDSNIDMVSNSIGEIRELGCLISIDNSGPVTETLLKLPRQSIKFLKFDGSVVRELASGDDSEALTAVMDMAKQLAIHTVATHIEDAHSLSEIWPYGFDYVQGHYFQMPDADMNYEFVSEDETTLSEDEISVPSWSQ